jgi:hypothetical protein
MMEEAADVMEKTANVVEKPALVQIAKVGRIEARKPLIFKYRILDFASKS